METVAGTVAGGSAELGATLALRVRVALGGLDPDDVEVQAVAGPGRTRTTPSRTPSVFPLKPAGGPDLEGRWVYEGPLALDRTGPFGYTVRVLPVAPAAGLRRRTGSGRGAERRRRGRVRAC